EFVYSMLAAQNIETLNQAAPKTIVASCPHCFNTIANEYPQLGGNYQVVHHTQLLARLVEQGKLTSATPDGEPAAAEKVTYHDPCFRGRHNKVYTPPREILEHVPGVEAVEMHRCKERGFCCGAGGARMWMEERIGKRIKLERIEEAPGTDPDTISPGCPVCLVMLGDAISAKKGSGEAKESLEVVDVAQLLARSVAQPVLAGQEGTGQAGPGQAGPGQDGSDPAGARRSRLAGQTRQGRAAPGWTHGEPNHSATGFSQERSPSWSSTCCRFTSQPATGCCCTA